MASVITFDPEGTMPGCVHGWAESLDMMGDGKPITTSQMGLLNHVFTDKYQEIRIAMRDGLAIVEKAPDGTWRTLEADGTWRRVPGNRLAEWRMNKLVRVPYDRPVGRISEYVGTPIECEAWLRTTFDVQRTYMRMADSDMDGGEIGSGGANADAYERTVWRVSVASTKAIAPTRVRDDPDTIVRCGRIDNERSLYEAAIGIASKKD